MQLQKLCLSLQGNLNVTLEKTLSNFKIILISKALKDKETLRD